MAASAPFARATALAEAHPAPEGCTYSYGTAGFRMNAGLLDAAVVRMGMLAAIRAKTTGKAVGVMVTASHNPVEDNGLKMVDPSGGMLEAAWEAHAADVAAAPAAQVGESLAAVASAAGLLSTDDDACSGAVVVLGWDTRPSSEHLADLVRKGCEAVGGTTADEGFVTTPQLHFLVASRNLTARACETSRLGGLEPTLDCYYARLRSAFLAVLNAGGAGIHPTASSSSSASRVGIDATTIIDAAGGVGGPAAKRVAGEMAHLGLRWEVRNLPGSVPLNDGCGAEAVQKGRRPCVGVDAASDVAPAVRLCSLDGDADRVVFHAFVPGGAAAAASTVWELVDGDKIASLLAVAVGALAARAGGAVAALNMGLVQTAYANGASTQWVAKRGLEVACAKTGVKHVHHKAESYDIGVYFEANGHGTVLFSPTAIATIDAAVDAALAAEPDLVNGSGATSTEAAARACIDGSNGDAGAAVEAAVAAMSPGAAAVVLQALTVLLSPYVGDAIADAVACEAVLRLGQAGVEEWIAMYVDLPSRQTKVRVADRLALTTVANESRLVQPEELQAAIDAAVAKVDSSTGRAFVRPSGTEDVVRVYAEAATVEQADALAALCVRAVFDLAGGVGDAPSLEAVPEEWRK